MGTKKVVIAYSDPNDTCLKDVVEYSITGVLAVLFICLVAFSHLRSSFSVLDDSADIPQSWARPRFESPGWLLQHDGFSKNLQIARGAKGLQVVFLGDSVIEFWLGSLHSFPDVRWEALPALFNKTFGSKHLAAALGIAGDATENVMWRLLNGEGLHGLGADLIVLSAGSADLTYASLQSEASIIASANRTALRLQRIVIELRDSAPHADVLVLGVLPRGDPTQHPQELVYDLPNKFTGATLAINSQMAAFVEGKPGLHFLDCADALLRPVSREPEQIIGGLMSGGNFATDAVDGLASKADRSLRLRRDLMATAQHPNVDGMKALAHCLAPKIDELFAKKQQPLAKMSP